MDRSRMKGERGFTLVELLVVIAIIGILAAIAIPQFSAYRKRGYASQAVSDIKNAATAEESYFVDYYEYASLLATLESRGYKQHTDVTLGIVGISAQGFVLTAGHSKCASGTWTYDSAAVGSSVIGGPCG